MSDDILLIRLGFPIFLFDRLVVKPKPMECLTSKATGSIKNHQRKEELRKKFLFLVTFVVVVVLNIPYWHKFLKQK